MGDADFLASTIGKGRRSMCGTRGYDERRQRGADFYCLPAKIGPGVERKGTEAFLDLE